MAGGFTGGLIKGIVLGGAALAALSLIAPQPEEAREPAEDGAAAQLAITERDLASDAAEAPADRTEAGPMPAPTDPVQAESSAAISEPIDSGDSGSIDAEVQDAGASIPADDESAQPVEAAPPATEINPLPSPEMDAGTPSPTPEQESSSEMPARSSSSSAVERAMQTDTQPSDSTAEPVSATQVPSAVATGPETEPATNPTRAAVLPQTLPLTILDAPDFGALVAPTLEAGEANFEQAPQAGPSEQAGDTENLNTTRPAPAAAVVVPAFGQPLEGAPPDLDAPSPPARAPTEPDQNASPADPIVPSIDLSLPPDLDRLSAPESR